MALKSLEEVIEKGLTGTIKDMPQRLENEFKDFLAHMPARYCKFKMDMKDYDTIVDFVNFVIRKEE